MPPKKRKKYDVTDVAKKVGTGEDYKDKKRALRMMDKIVNPPNPAWNKARLSDDEVKDYDKYHEARKKRLKKLYLKHKLPGGFGS